MAAEHRRVVWAPRAKQDLREVWRYYARVASPDVADKLLRDISQAGERLKEEALMWRARDDVMPGLRSVLLGLNLASALTGDC
jgi:plasmid stabilization system protein ParE